MRIDKALKIYLKGFSEDTNAHKIDPYRRK
jgi:hypothetical protein